MHRTPARHNRRSFLATGGTAAASLALASCAQGRRAPRRGRVIVVGAGIAGLVAAHDLDAAGYDVVVAEARSRVGGRIRTVRAPFSGGQYAEAGGEFIDTTHTMMRSIARQAGLSLSDVRKGADVDREGTVRVGGVDRTDSAARAGATGTQLEALDARVEALSRKLSIADPVGTGAALDRRSVADLLDELALSPEARFLAEADIRNEYTVEPDRLSLLFHAYLYRRTEELPESGVEAFRITGGNDQVPRAIAEDLGARIVHLRAPVTRIERPSGGGVRVTIGGERVSARWCVLAAPLPAVRDIAFSPALPAALAAAIDDVQYGVGTKELLQYDRRFWRDSGRSGDLLTDGSVGAAWQATDRQAGTRGILIGYTAADRGAAYTALGEKARLAEAAASIDEAFPGSADLVHAGASTAWAAERFTGGTYTAWKPGDMTRHWNVLRRPIGPLVLAGEHTSTYASYMEGGARSGRTASTTIRRADA